MTQKLYTMLCTTAALFALFAAATLIRAQSGSQGTVSVTVTDASGGVVPAASLQLVDQATNNARKASASGSGGFTFVNLPVGVYTLTVTEAGYQTAVVSEVGVHAAQTTDVTVVLKVGTPNESVEVNASTASLLEVSSNSIGTVVDMKQIEDLPLTGRNLTQLATYTPGYAGTTGTGEWNGQPLISQGTNIDGTLGSSSRMKIFGNASPAVAPRVEDISEMTVQTDQLDLDQGFGQAVTQSNFVTRRGTNEIHGRVFENFHNSGLNANSWSNNVRGLRRAKSIYNDFGGSVGGPIIKDKLFFYGTYAMQKIPGGFTASNYYLTPAAQTGNFTYTGTDGNQHTVNVLTIAHSYSSTLPGSVNSIVGTQLSAINSSLASGKSNTISDPNINQISWYNNNSQTTYFPFIRADYSATQKVRMSLSWAMTYNQQPGANAAAFPGSAFSDMAAGYKTKNYTSSYAIDWEVSPRLINQFKFGFLYDVQAFAYNAKQLYATQPTVNWAVSVNYAPMSGQSYQLPTTSYYPAFNATDTVTFQKGSHTLKAGFTGYREQDHYWNPPSGFPNYNLGLATGDPAINAFTTSPGGTVPYAGNSELSEAQDLYATLTGRISSVGGSNAYSASAGGYLKPGTIGSYALDEVTLAWGLFAQDSYRLSPSFTVNYGLRWDFTGQSVDKSGLYHNADPSSVYGPTAPNELFQPGKLNGNLNPMLVARARAYEPWHVTPQPAIGFAWNPRWSDGALGKLAGGGKTVIRAGYSLRRFTEPYQYYWNNVSDQGSFFYQNFSLSANNTGTTGTFAPGSLSLGDTMPAYLLNPTSYQKSVPEADFTFEGNCPGCGNGVVGIDSHIKQPYTQTWNLGIQRQFGSRVLEIRYAGNRNLHQWINNDTNEVNVFENGFLDEFKLAQANLNSYMTANPDCANNGTCSFANNGLSGQSPLPIMNAAFAGEPSGGPGIPMADYANGTFVYYLQTGQVGALAGALSGIGTTAYLCNLVGSGFAPCVNNAGYTGGAGAGKPINFFQANPYAAGYQTQYMTAGGYSNYHSLQVDLRQGQWNGLQFDFNYTLAHSLGFGVNTNGPGGVTCGGYDGWCAWPDTITLRNLRLAYGPAQYDIRHVFHFTGTYDLPFGKGKAFLNTNNLAARMLGNWTIGTIATFQTGTPQELSSGNLTFNDYGDGGIRLNNVTISQLQKAVGVHRLPGKTYALLLNPKYLQNADGTGGANPSYITPNTTPGTVGSILYLHGPHAFYNDLSLSKTFPIFEAVQFKLQAEATNAWNHPVFGSTSGSFGGAPTYNQGNVQNYGFATSGVTNNPRVIEFRANIDF
ncbi:MAG TPA: carboxypeptidase-like regulatory domain-containing protein [Terracidiphilus sp.]|nr:carboxypeptidase-like regulatory domain-containing protein [Terracidiphilus sp.]